MWCVWWMKCASVIHVVVFVLDHAEGGGVHPGQERVSPACLFCRNRDPEALPRGTALTLGMGLTPPCGHCWSYLRHKNVPVFYVIPVVSLLQLLGSLISDFVDSFRPTARINSICGELKTLAGYVLHCYCYIWYARTHTHAHIAMPGSEVCVLFLCVCIRSL